MVAAIVDESLAELGELVGRGRLAHGKVKDDNIIFEINVNMMQQMYDMVLMILVCIYK